MFNSENTLYIRRLITNLVYLALTYGGCCVAWFAWIAPPALKYTTVPFRVIDPHVYYPGETVDMAVTRCTNRSVPFSYIWLRSLENQETNQLYQLPPIDLVMEPGCVSSISQLHKIPTGVSPGTYTLRGTAIVPRLMGQDLVPFHSQSFKVSSGVKPL